VMLLDADERFHYRLNAMTCRGDSTPPDEANDILQAYDFRDLKTLIPNFENLKGLGKNCTVEYGPIYNQGQLLRDAIAKGYDVIKTIRRHWHDIKMTKPTQNWHTDADWQMRCIRNIDRIGFAPNTRMHEQLQGYESVYEPDGNYGPFMDHQHFFFKQLEMAQRSHDVAIYDAVHEGRTPPTPEEFAEGKR